MEAFQLTAKIKDRRFIIFFVFSLHGRHPYVCGMRRHGLTHQTPKILAEICLHGGSPEPIFGNACCRFLVMPRFLREFSKGIPIFWKGSLYFLGSRIFGRDPSIGIPNFWKGSLYFSESQFLEGIPLFIGIPNFWKGSLYFSGSPIFRRDPSIFWDPRIAFG